LRSCWKADGLVVGYTLRFSDLLDIFEPALGLWLEDLYVTRSSGVKGTEKALLNHLIDYCQTNGFGRLDWSVLDWNEPSIRLLPCDGRRRDADWRICRMSFPDGRRAWK